MLHRNFEFNLLYYFWLSIFIIFLSNKNSYIDSLSLWHIIKSTRFYYSFYSLIKHFTILFILFYYLWKILANSKNLNIFI
jgi:hypothetical protein